MAISSFPGVCQLPGAVSAIAGERRAGRSVGQSRMGEKENSRARRSLWGQLCWREPGRDHGRSRDRPVASPSWLLALGPVEQGWEGREPCWRCLSSLGGVSPSFAGFAGTAWLHGAGAASRDSNVSYPYLEPSLISLKVLRGRSEVSSSLHRRRTITHFARDISLTAVLLPSPVGAEIPSPRVYLQGRMLEQ